MMKIGTAALRVRTVIELETEDTTATMLTYASETGSLSIAQPGRVNNNEVTFGRAALILLRDAVSRIVDEVAHAEPEPPAPRTRADVQGKILNHIASEKVHAENAPQALARATGLAEEQVKSALRRMLKLGTVTSQGGVLCRQMPAPHGDPQC